MKSAQSEYRQPSLFPGLVFAVSTIFGFVFRSYLNLVFAVVSWNPANNEGQLYSKPWRKLISMATLLSFHAFES